MVSSLRPLLLVSSVFQLFSSLSAFAPRPRPNQAHNPATKSSRSIMCQTTPANAAEVAKRPFKYEASQDIQSIYHQMDVIDKKVPMSNSPIAFWASALLGVPIWLTILVPFTILASSLHFIFIMITHGKLFPSSETPVLDDDVAAEKVNSGDESVTIIPRESRKYDIVLLGATGFTGKLGAAYLAKQYGVGSKSKVKWAIAGRSKSKIERTLQSISKELGSDDVLDVDVIITDTSDRSTLKKLVSDTRAVISTAGPFQKYGSSVVEFCVKYGTHYADITGEVDWSKKMMKLYESSAQRTGAKIVSLCGHDSIPWDLTVRCLSEKLREECNDELVSVECLNEMKGDISGGTLATVYESLDRGVKDFEFGSSPTNELDVYSRLLDGSESPFKVESDLPLTISPCRNPDDRFSDKWCGPFVMAAINMAVVQRSVALSTFGNATVKYREAVVAVNFMDAFTMWFGLVMIGTLIFNPVTRPVVQKLLPQPGEGPSVEMRMEGFLCVTGYGVGTNGNSVESVMYFPHDGGYQSTSRMLVESGLCLALDEERHSFSGGGFYSPASVMCDALLDRLVNTGSKFACSVKG